MTAEESLNKLLRDVVNLIVGDGSYAIRAKQKDATRPQGSYGDVDLVTDTSIGWEHRYYGNQPDPELDLVENIEGIREFQYSLGFYRDSAIDNARLVRTALIREAIQSLFLAGKVGLIRRSDVRHISEPLENGWEERAQFDVFLSVVGTDSDIVRSIGSVDIAGEFQIRNISYNFNIEV